MIQIKDLRVDTAKMGRVFIDDNIWASGQNHNFLKNSPSHRQHCHAARRQGLPRKRRHAEAEEAGRACHPRCNQEACPGSPLHNPHGDCAGQP